MGETFSDENKIRVLIENVYMLRPVEFYVAGSANNIENTID